MADQGDNDGDRVPEAMRHSLDSMMLEAIRSGDPVSVGRIVQALQTIHPDHPLSPIQLAEAVLRLASAHRLPVVIG